MKATKSPGFNCDLFIFIPAVKNCFVVLGTFMLNNSVYMWCAKPEQSIPLLLFPPIL